MNYAKSYIDNFRKYSAAVAAEKEARATLEAEYSARSITKATFDAKLAAILETAPKEAEFRKKADKIVADFDAAYSAWIVLDGSKVDAADLAVLNPTFITSAADLQHLADKHRFSGYHAACLENDKFCQKFIDMVDVLDGKELLTDTIEE